MSELIYSILGVSLNAIGTFIMWFGGWRSKPKVHEKGRVRIAVKRVELRYSVIGASLIAIGTFVLSYGGWRSNKQLEGNLTGGDTFCYWMLYDFDLSRNVAKDFTVIRKGTFPLYDGHMRIVDLQTKKEVTVPLGNLHSPANFEVLTWPLPQDVYYRVFFDARNGSWRQDLILKRSQLANCWLAATRVFGNKGEVRFEHLDNEFIKEFGKPVWQQ